MAFQNTQLTKTAMYTFSKYAQVPQTHHTYDARKKPQDAHQFHFLINFRPINRQIPTRSSRAHLK